MFYTQSGVSVLYLVRVLYPVRSLCFILTGQHSYFGVTLKLLYFRNETYFGAGNLYKDLFSIYLQPSVNNNS